MKNSILNIMIGLFLVGALCTSLAVPASAIVPLKVPIKILYAAPNENSEIVFNIPIEVAMLGMTEDLNWFRVRIKFDFAFLNYDYTGWVNIPVGSSFKLPPLAPQNIP